MSTSYQILYWRDIPAQVKLRNGAQRVSRSLTERFQQAIDAAAMLAHSTSTDDYLEEWRSSEWQAREGEVEATAEALVSEIERTYTPERLQELVLNKGFAR